MSNTIPARWRYHTVSLSHQTRGLLGGSSSDLSPALLKLARDPEVDAAIAITDGDIDYPPYPLPYNVLWAITGAVPSSFRPSYGRVLQIGAG